MADLSQTKSDPKKQFWDNVDDVTAVTMGIPKLGLHMQPMAPLPAKDEGVIWFYAKNSSELVKALGSDSNAQISLVSKDQDYYASIFGTCSISTERAVIDRFWSPMVAAWFEGKDDPELVMIAFSPSQAAVWVSSGNLLEFGWEIAKANITDGRPDVGEHITLSFSDHPHI